MRLAAQGFGVRLWGLHGLEDLYKRFEAWGSELRGLGCWGVGGPGFKAWGFRLALR